MIRSLVLTAALVSAPFATHAAAFKSLYSFGPPPDASSPNGPLLLVDHALYGVSSYGGAYGHGTLYEVNPQTGAEAVLYSFTGGIDGDYPNGRLVYQAGALYGTAEYGGISSSGLIFKFDLTTKVQSVLYAFSYYADPQGGVIKPQKDLLYGVTRAGGYYNQGQIYMFDLSTSKYTTIYNFFDNSNGEFPTAGLVYFQDALFGTTEYGGSGRPAYGTVFKFDLHRNTESLLYTFRGGTDGSYPVTDLAVDSGLLYGTVENSGVAPNGKMDRGRIFSIDPTTGALVDVYDFQGGTTGRWPAGGVTLHDDALCGMDYTSVYSVDPTTGIKTTLHGFHSPNGNSYITPLTSSPLALYGVSQGGGFRSRKRLQNCTLTSRTAWPD